MQAPIASYDRFLPLALQLADAAGDILRRHFRTALPPERKDDASPVTLADREVEAAIRGLIEAAMPEHGIIGEEFGDVRDEAEFQWVIDPIDGTRSFMAGYPIFATLIALAHKGVPVLGIIDQPILRERWAALQGGTATLNGKPAVVRGCASLDKAVIASTSAHYFTPAQGAAYGKLVEVCGHKAVGGDAYAYAMLASGQLDIVVDAGMKPFDYCALAPVVAGAGGVITDWKGKALTTGSDGAVLACANMALHTQALAILSAA